MADAIETQKSSYNAKPRFSIYGAVVRDNFWNIPQNDTVASNKESSATTGVLPPTTRVTRRASSFSQAKKAF